MRDLVLAIDAGGTAVKVLLLDAAGQTLGLRMAAVVTTHHPDGRVERDAEAFWQATAAAITAVLAEDPARAGRVAAIGCTGFGNGGFFVDASGRATRPGIVSVDHRAQPLVTRLQAEGHAVGISAVSGQKLWGGQTLMQLAHLAAAEPEVMAQTSWVLSCKDYIRMCLTGTACADATDVSGSGLMDMDSGGYAAQAFAALNMPEIAGKMPPMVENSAVGGMVSAAAAAQTGLRAGTPVAGSMMDVAACALGAGSVGTDHLVMIAGTWAINCLEIARGSALGTALPLMNMLHRDGQCQLLCEGSPSSAANLGWYLTRGLGGRVSLAEANEMVATSPVQTRRCHFLPYVYGAAPRMGSFLGLVASDDTATMLQAIYEGVAFQHRRHAEELMAHLAGTGPKAIRLAGGAARSGPWAQIFADICQMPVEVCEAEEVGALGAAICAAVAGGLHPDLTQAVAAMARVGRRYAPNLAHARFYDERFQEFQKLDQGLLALPA
ncbi:FGGY-family carbohydrate kinase [Phaeovulum sp. W22_SRMD_FR3]|uniref:FGGY-family carbohydrate kinase n=1 Tax=Phaeovulum sp. W22_SRMD_FR3 TaxID=3240274 RepID=UPI003F980442